MEPLKEKSFANVSIVSGAIIAIISSIVIYGLALMSVSNGNPSMAGLVIGCFMCCGFVILPGLLSSRLYIYELQRSIELGKGALIGAVSGLAFGVIFGFMDVIWKIFDVDTTSLMVEYYILVMQNLDFPEMNDAIDQVREAQDQASSGIGSIITNIVVVSIINVLSGLAGAAVFNKKFEKNEF